MASSEQEIIRKVRQGADAAQKLFSNGGQALQERTTVAGLLRCLGVPFSEDELVKSSQEPIDVTFRCAHFQVMEITDRGRPRNHEIKQWSDRVRRAKSLHDLCEQVDISSHPITPADLQQIVVKSFRAKALKYAQQSRTLDLLVYFNLQRRYLYPFEPFPTAPPPECAGWRSVSLSMELFAVVLWAAEDAPPFLIEHQGQAVEWKGTGSVFPKNSMVNEHTADVAHRADDRARPTR